MRSKFEQPIILGISCFYHDSAAAVIANGEIIAAAQEERFTRKKFDSDFPEHAINFCLESAGIDNQDIDCVAFYDDPLVKLDRIIESQTRFAPLKLAQNYRRIHEWIDHKFSLDQLIYRRLPGFKGEIFFSHHHVSHAASAFYPSPFGRAAVVVADAMGEWSCSSIAEGNGSRVTILKEQHFPHSVGLLYSAITQHIGFRVNSGEYKVMGLAPYGESRYVELIKEHLVEIYENGSIVLNTDYFDFMTGNRMTNHRLEDLFGSPDREPESILTQREMDIAKSIQIVVEEIMLNMTRHAVALTGLRALVLAGGVALNCVANGKIQRSGLIDNLWIQPAAGDAGGALGAALYAHYNVYNQDRIINNSGDSQKGTFLGPVYEKKYIRMILDTYGFTYEELAENDKCEKICDLICEGGVIALFQGRMEFGPRALGARSIIGDARIPEMQKHMNLKIKYRESFRPFAPVVLLEDLAEWFETSEESPYMLLTTSVKGNRLVLSEAPNVALFGIDKLNVVRSEVPAITHVDNSARIQTVDSKRNPFLHGLLKTFKEKTGCPILINTSFNIRGEPIVCTPLDALNCFMNTDIDYLLLEWFLIDKKKQGKQLKDENFKKKKGLD